jgi:nucleoside-specific outer membrane channel protein Tsx
MKNIVLCWLLAWSSFHCDAAINWQQASLTYLYGTDYRIGDPKRHVLTLEHAANTSWGDSFLFIDHSVSTQSTHTTYGEWSPRFSLGKNTTWQPGSGLIKDVLLASTIEQGERFTNFLYGVGLDLAIPGMKFTQLNFYRRQNDIDANNYQATLAWALPFQIGGQALLYDGFIDYSSAHGEKATSVNFTSQLKFPIQSWFGVQNPIYLGSEISLWRNKYHIANSAALKSNEVNVNFLLKWMF